MTVDSREGEGATYADMQIINTAGIRNNRDV